MKKLVITSLVLLTCGVAYALPVGNPTEASTYTNGIWNSCFNDLYEFDFNFCDAWSLRFGFYGDYVYNQHMEAKGGDYSDIDNLQLYTNAGYLVLNLCNSVEAFATLGGTNFVIQTNVLSFGGGNAHSQIIFDTEFSWSVGLRATLLKRGCFGIGAEGQYFQSNPNLNEAIFYNLGQIFAFNTENSCQYREWQVGLGASYQFATAMQGLTLIPYAAVKWSDSQFDINRNVVPGFEIIVPNLKAKNFWGYAIGASLTLNDMLGVTVEGRWANEKALYVNGEIRF